MFRLGCVPDHAVRASAGEGAWEGLGEPSDIRGSFQAPETLS